jgi:hypothetical protein
MSNDLDDWKYVIDDYILFSIENNILIQSTVTAVISTSTKENPVTNKIKSLLLLFQILCNLSQYVDWNISFFIIFTLIFKFLFCTI